MWDSTMDEVTFRSDTVLSDVHLYTPNHRHLMVRLNGVGQPVFLSQFKLLWSQDSWMDSGAEGGDHRHVPTQEAPPAGSCGPGSPPGPGYSHEGCSLQARADSTDQEGAGAQLDEDGDLDVVRRPRASSDTDPAKPPRDKVHPTILTQEEEDVLEDEATGSCPQSIIKIEHTMATPLEDVGKQVWQGALLLADYILFRRDLFQGRTVLELGAGTGFASIVAATMARTVYCTDVGADLLAMCQRNITLNSHLAAAGGGIVKVRELDWLKDNLCTASCGPGASVLDKGLPGSACCAKLPPTLSPALKLLWARLSGRPGGQQRKDWAPASLLLQILRSPSAGQKRTSLTFMTTPPCCLQPKCFMMTA
ncbi:PREDICTED: methyltransferase-like protein 22 isoform X7 [Chinchilla lanigera]|uniref:methyltransferase-like protein 22 isoform X7 n=1 Tax=Chinchilla lanigera TaxID=34839 RepID=UPI000697FCF2|nr:PREDICTED: methyltransferase-like protein 22 isoform X7 [Chinchilla lanigera]